MARGNLTNRNDDRNQAKTFGKRLKIFLGGATVVALCVAIRCYWSAPPASADQPDQGRRATSGTSTLKVRPSSAEKSQSGERRAASNEKSKQAVPEIVAAVNIRRITRNDLAKECIAHYGKDVLESLVNKQLIIAECRRKGINVARSEVNAEIERMAKRFNIPVEQWLTMLEQERNVTADQYADDIIWPTLALRKLAGSQLTVSREELIQEFETCYGEAVRARLIASNSPEKAKKLRAKAAANPDDFGNLAKNYSEDTPSASVKGVIQPIRKHGSYKEIEDAVFHMADGEVSQVIHAGGQYVILKREGLIPARPVKFEQVAPQLEELVRDRNMRGVAEKLFDRLQKSAKVVNVWNDPAKRRQMPGVAAMVDGAQISMGELADQCVARHGRETLDGMISREILEQACKKRGIEVTEADLNAEIARAALAGVAPKPDGSPDVKAWLKLVEEHQGLSLELYRNDAVWPSMALKKIVGDKVQVTDEDLRKGFDANYGQRVRCLAIVLDNFRRAQQVFDLARRKNTSEYFGDLAAEYSVEPGSQALRGEIPPIKKHGGQPKIEEEAFALRPGELSGIIQAGDKYIILRCEGFTDPVGVKFADVRDEIYRDLHEKKLRLAMGDGFEKLVNEAAVDNYLTGETRSPKRADKAAPAANLPSFHQVPSG